jgi:hypothetical protein
VNIEIDYSYMRFERHIRYAINVLLNDVLEIDCEIPVQVYYGHELQRNECPNMTTLQIVPSDFFTREAYLTAGSLPQSPISWIQATELDVLRSDLFEEVIPVLYWGASEEKDIVFRESDLIRTKADLIASAFFMLTRYEEIIVKDRDEYDRFPATSSLAYKEGFLHRPIVNEYAELLWDWITTLLPNARRKSKVYKVKLTHDVDQVRKYRAISKELRISASLAIKHLQPWKAINHLTDMAMTRWGRRNDPYSCYDELMDISDRNGCKACFYFMASDLGSPDTQYEVDEESIIRIITNILERGHEIGLHPGLGTYQSLEKLQLQKENLDRVLGYKDYGARQHYLQWKAPDTWRLYEEVGLTHDSSVGYIETPGFRGGICMPFYVFDALAGKKLNLREIPLITSDTSLFSKKYSDLGYDQQKNNLVKSIKYRVKKVSGNYCLLWHNSSCHKYGVEILNDLINNDT